MFQQISWAGYFEFIFFSCLIYYTTIIVLYYRTDLQLKFMQYRQRLGKIDATDTGNAQPNIKIPGDGQQDIPPPFNRKSNEADK